MCIRDSWCGVRSGRDFDKFRETGLTPVPAERVAAPLIAEAPVSIECRCLLYTSRTRYVGVAMRRPGLSSRIVRLRFVMMKYACVPSAM